MTKKFIGVVLAALMVLALVPVSVFARSYEAETPVKAESAWVPTDEIVVGTEYLIGFVVGGNVYLAMNYNDSGTLPGNHYYYSVNGDYCGYTAAAVLDGNNITGCSGWTDDLTNCKWTFSSTEGGKITGANNYYLAVYGISTGSDLCPYSILNSQWYGDNWVWDSTGHTLSINNGTARYASYLATGGSYSNFMNAITTPDETSYVQLYSYQEVTDPGTPAAVEVTYTGETKSICTPAQDSSFIWNLEISENSSTIGAILLVDYDENVLECVDADTETEGCIDYIYDNEDHVASAQPTVEVRTVYEGQTGENKYGEAGNIYAIVLVYSHGYVNEGIQIGGILAKLNFKWKTAPAASPVEIPVQIVESYCHDNPRVSHDATVVNGVVNVLAHDWGAPAYVWSDGNAACTATAICANDPTHVLTETVNAVYTVVTEPTVEAPGLGRYTATFENELFETQIVEVEIPQLEPQGYHINVHNYTSVAAATTSIDPDQLYSGEVTFTVDCGLVCVVFVDNGDGTYTRLVCNDADDAHSYTVTVTDADVDIVIVVRGDTNLNGKLETADSTLVKRAVAGLTPLSGDTAAIKLLAADVNFSGTLQTADSTLILRAVAGLAPFNW